MTSNTRRPGFRLWGGDQADEPEGSDSDQPAEQAEVGAVSAEAPAPSPATAETVAPAPAPAPEPASPESAGFLASLVGAMRSVADETRETGLAELRAAVDARVGELERDASAQADDLRRQAELDIAGIADWRRSETERIAGEAETKTATRRQALEQQIADHQATSEARMAATRARLAEHEQELRSFFAQLSEVNDPAAFVAAAGRMPRPPLLDNDAPTRPVAPRRTLDARLAELGVDRGDAAASAWPKPPAPVADMSPATLPEPPEPAAKPDASRDVQLAERIAQLDEQMADAPAATPAPSNGTTGAEAGSDTSTAVVVKGLGSFGAITSFKQALERVDGIDGVTLSLGPTGEFVYRASHAPGYDLAGAVRSIEGPGVQIEDADGSLRVTVSRSR